jgi:hypothetical protein
MTRKEHPLISNILKGTDAAGLIDYIFASHDGEGRVRDAVVDLGGTVAGRSPTEISQQFRSLATARPLLSKSVAHLMLSWTGDDRVSLEDQALMAERHAENLGYKHWRAVSHSGHLHIVASRVNADGTVVSDSEDYRRGEASRAELEVQFHLVRVPASHLRAPENRTSHVRAPSRAELALSAKGEPSVRSQLQEAVAASIAGGVAFSAFVERLRAQGIEVRPNVQKTGRVCGISFRLDGYEFKGSSLGQGFSWGSLKKRGLDYEQNRDSKVVGECCDRCPAPRDSRDDGQGVGKDERGRSRAGPDRGHIDPTSEGIGQPLRGDEINPEGLHGKDARDRSRAGPDRGQIDPVGGIIGRPVRGGEIGPERRPGNRFESSGGVRSQDQDGYGGSRDRDNPSHANPAGNAPKIPGDQHLRQRSERPRPSQYVANSTNRGRCGDGGANGADVRDFARSAHPSVATHSIDAGPVEVIDGTEDAAEFLRKWSRNMARQLAAGKAAQALGSANTSSPLILSPAGRTLRSLALRTSADDPTVAQVRRQVQAFGSEYFEVGILPPRHRSDLLPQRIRRFSAETLSELSTIRWLRRMNLLGFDIYCRPAPYQDGSLAPLVFLDDVSRSQMARMATEGLPLAVAIESSPGRFHGWCRIGSNRISRDEALEAARLLAHRFGGDLGAVSSRQFGRLSGFTNRKAYHRTEKGQPFARLHAASLQVAAKGSELLVDVRAVLAEGRERLRGAQSEGWDRHVSARSDNAVDAFRVARSYIAGNRADGTVDESTADFGAAAALIESGWGDDSVAAAIVLASPGIKYRHRDTQRYADRTVEAARRKVGRINTASRVPTLRP